jgi:hypothetical protein
MCSWYELKNLEEENIMDNEKWLEQMKNLTQQEETRNEGMIQIVTNDYRQTKALEIIAEELIKLNENSEYVITTLENIETTMKAR